MVNLALIISANFVEFRRCQVNLNLKMNKAFREMLTGVLLGDAHIGRTGLDKAYITCEQSKKNSYAGIYKLFT